MGFIIHQHKCSLTPAQSITYIGHQITTTNNKIQIGLSDSYRNKIYFAFKSSPDRQTKKLTKNRIQSLKGLLAAALGGHYSARPQLACLRTVFPEHREHHIITPHARKILEETKAAFKHQQPIQITIHRRLQPSAIIYADASDNAAGIHLQLDSKSTTQLTYHFDNNQLQLHINRKEIIAAILALRSAHHHLQPNQSAIIYLDNITALAAIRKQYVQGDPQLQQQLQHILRSLYKKRIIIKTAYIPSAQNLADNPSRSRSRNDFRLNPGILNNTLLQYIGTGINNVTMDLFASSHNRQVQKYASLLPEPQATVVNAFSIKWTPNNIGNLPYANPPFPIMAEVIEKIIKEVKTPFILIAPVWKRRTWWPRLVNIAQLIYLPQVHDLFLPPHRLEEHHCLRPPNWNTVLAIIHPEPNSQ